jgi:hypothetical protein
MFFVISVCDAPFGRNGVEGTDRRLATTYLDFFNSEQYCNDCGISFQFCEKSLNCKMVLNVM